LLRKHPKPKEIWREKICGRRKRAEQRAKARSSGTLFERRVPELLAFLSAHSFGKDLSSGNEIQKKGFWQ